MSYQCIHRTFGIYRRRFGDPGYRDQLLHEAGQIVPLNFSPKAAHANVAVAT